MTMTARLSHHGSGTAIAEGEPEAMLASRPSPPPPPRTPPLSLRQPTFRGDLATQVMVTLFQLMIVRKQWTRASSMEARLVPTLSLAYFSIFLLFMIFLPRLYWRHRTWLLPLHMVGITLTPWHNRIDAALGLLLSQPPQPGPVSCVRDVLRIAGGTRGSTMLLWTVLVMHPPLAALLAHAVITLQAWNPLYCTTAALSAPLARQRQAVLARVLDALCVPLQAVQPLVGQLPTSFRDEQALCLAATGWFHLVVQLIVPLLYHVWRWQPPRSSSSTAHGPSCSGLGGALGRAAAASNRVLHLALGGSAGWPVRLAVAYYILANAWLICRV